MLHGRRSPLGGADIHVRLFGVR